MASEIEHYPQPTPTPKRIANGSASQITTNSTTTTNASLSQPQSAAESPAWRTRILMNGESAALPPLDTAVVQPLFPDAPSDIFETGGEDEPTAPSSSQVVSPITSPPYWMMQTQTQHNRSMSNASAESVLPAGVITLQDNENNDDGRGNGNGGHIYGWDRNRACWAKSVEVASHTVVNGSATNIGAFVVWNIRVETLSGSFMNIRKRYSEFDDFRKRLIQTFPNFEAAVPVLPPKSVISKFRPRFLEKRRAGLQYFLNCILLNPEFSGSPVLKDFLFS